MTVNQNSIALSSDRGSLEIAGVSLLYEGTRVKSYLLGRDLNPMGRGDGALYAEGMFSAGNTRPRPNSKPIGGKGNSVNNTYCPPGGGCGSGPTRIDIEPPHPWPLPIESGWTRESDGKELNPADCGFPSLDVYSKALSDCDSIQDGDGGSVGPPEEAHPEVDAGPGDANPPKVYYTDECMLNAYRAFEACTEAAKTQRGIDRRNAHKIWSDSTVALRLIDAKIWWVITRAQALYAGIAVPTAISLYYGGAPVVIIGSGILLILYHGFGINAFPRLDLSQLAEEYFNLLFDRAREKANLYYADCLFDNARRKHWNSYHNCLCALHNALRKCVKDKCGKDMPEPSACSGDTIKDACKVQLIDCENKRDTYRIAMEREILRYAWFYAFRAWMINNPTTLPFSPILFGFDPASL